MSAPGVVTKDYSQSVGTTAVWIFPQGTGLQGQGVSFMRIWNVSGTGTIWLSRNGSPAVVGAPGSFPLPPGEFELFNLPDIIPLNGLSAIATVAGTALTVEVG